MLLNESKTIHMNIGFHPDNKCYKLNPYPKTEVINRKDLKTSCFWAFASHLHHQFVTEEASAVTMIAFFPLIIGDLHCIQRTYIQAILELLSSITHSVITKDYDLVDRLQQKATRLVACLSHFSTYLTYLFPL